MIGRSILDYNELSTLLVENEGVINTQPITYVYDDDKLVSYAALVRHQTSNIMRL